jgi:hypothetical protein
MAAGMAVMSAAAVEGLTVGIAIAAAAVGGAVGSIVSQGAAMAMGQQDKFSWRAVATSSLTSAFTAGVGAYAGAGGVAGQMGASGVGQVALNGAINSAIGQGVNIVTGQQDNFSWRAMAASAVGAVGSSVIPNNGFASSVAGKMIGNAARQYIMNGDVDWKQAAVDAFGNTLGNAVVAETRLATIPSNIKSMKDDAVDAYKLAVWRGQSDADAQKVATFANQLAVAKEDFVDRYKDWQVLPKEEQNLQKFKEMFAPASLNVSQPGTMVASNGPVEIEDSSGRTTLSAADATGLKDQVAWSSYKGLNGVLDVHNIGIQNLVGASEPDKAMFGLSEDLVDAKGNQDGASSFMHFMYGKDMPVVDAAGARAMANAWVGYTLLQAWGYSAAQDNEMASFFVGVAMHAAQDYTSPMHTDAAARLPKDWNPPHGDASTYEHAKFFLGTEVQHGLGEFIFPGVNSNMHNAAQDIFDIYGAGVGALDPIFDRSSGGFDFSSRWGVDAPGQLIVTPPPVTVPRIMIPGPRYIPYDGIQLGATAIV